MEVFSCKAKLEPRWAGLYIVSQSLYFAVKVTGKESLIHHSHVKCLPQDHLVDEQ